MYLKDKNLEFFWKYRFREHFEKFLSFSKLGLRKLPFKIFFLQISKCYLFGYFGVFFSGVYLETKYLKKAFFSDCKLKNVKYFFR